MSEQFEHPDDSSYFEENTYVDADDMQDPHGLDNIMLEKIKNASPEDIEEALDLAEARHSEKVEVIAKAHKLGLEFQRDGIENLITDARGAIGARILLERWRNMSAEERPLFNDFVVQEGDREDQKNHDDKDFVVELIYAADYVGDGYFDLELADLFTARENGTPLPRPNPEYGYESKYFKSLAKRIPE